MIAMFQERIILRIVKWPTTAEEFSPKQRKDDSPKGSKEAIAKKLFGEDPGSQDKSKTQSDRFSNLFKKENDNQ